MNIEYIKDYKYKELKQYIFAYLLIVIASVGLYAKNTVDVLGILPTLFSMIAIDTLAGAICAIVFIINELWSDKFKRRIVYKKKLPSDTIFSDIASEKIDASGFNLARAKKIFKKFAHASPDKQTAEWNKLLQKYKDANRGNVIEAERMQLMTRDICMSTISLLIMTSIAFLVLSFAYGSICTALKLLGIPLIYLIIMFFVTRRAAQSRARRAVVLVIKNAVQDSTR
mgnify:CR=1 FL=1